MFLGDGHQGKTFTIRFSMLVFFKKYESLPVNSCLFYDNVMPSPPPEYLVDVLSDKATLYQVFNELFTKDLKI
jgi:hypothetical protein